MRKSESWWLLLYILFPCYTGLSHTPGPCRAVQPWHLAEPGVSSPPWVFLSVFSPGPPPVNTDRDPTDKKGPTCAFCICGYMTILYIFAVKCYFRIGKINTHMHTHRGRQKSAQKCQVLEEQEGRISEGKTFGNPYTKEKKNYSDWQDIEYTVQNT